ncbi:MAG: CDP-diacylglycerol--glycerol-3-phosphate 3-phosphatidyltransferase [Butyricicoccus sp.]
MTTANKITLTRIAMIPFFIYFAAQPMLNVEEYKVGIFSFPTCTLIALILFCVASFTDFLDGYVARKYNQVTDFGKFVDPLADKLLVASALILFVEQKAMAGWMVCVILARELIITFSVLQPIRALLWLQLGRARSRPVCRLAVLSLFTCTTSSLALWRMERVRCTRFSLSARKAIRC